jgi:hypothetical protein
VSAYVEIHCDVRKEGRDPKEPASAFCWTHRNDNPQGGSIGAAKLEARRQGWKLTAGNRAVCPNCAGDVEPHWFPEAPHP